MAWAGSDLIEFSCRVQQSESPDGLNISDQIASKAIKGGNAAVNERHPIPENGALAAAER